MSGCGLPTQILVAPPAVLSRNGALVTFELEKSNGFVLYYKVYSPDVDFDQNLSESGYSREEDIFRHFGYHKSFPSVANSVVKPRFIWQPMAGQAPPYIVELNTTTGQIFVKNGGGQILFQDELIRVNLLPFSAMERAHNDVGSQSNTGQLVWAGLNTELDIQTMTLQLSKPVFYTIV